VVVRAQVPHATGQISFANAQAASLLSSVIRVLHVAESGSPLQNSLHVPVPSGHSPESSTFTQAPLSGSWHGKMPLLAGVRQAVHVLDSSKVDGSNGVTCGRAGVVCDVCELE